MSRSRVRVAPLLAGVALALTACGGDDSSSSTQAADLEAQIAELQQELAENANADLQRQLADLEAQIAELENETPSSSAASATPTGGGEGGVTSLEDVPAPLELSDEGLYDTQEDAERAGEAVGCEGSHEMGGQYMPCGMHGELDEIEAETEQAPPPEESPIEDETAYAPPTNTPDAPATPVDTEIKYSIEQTRINPSSFKVSITASVPGSSTNTLGIKAVCLYQYNIEGASIHGDPKKPCSNRNGLLAAYLPYPQFWTVIGGCGVNSQIKDYYDVGIVAEDGRSLVVRVKDSAC